VIAREVRVIIGQGIRACIRSGARRHQPHHTSGEHDIVPRASEAAGSSVARTRDAMDGIDQRRAGVIGAFQRHPAHIGISAPDACRAWSARCRALSRPIRRPEEQSLETPSGRTAAARDERPEFKVLFHHRRDARRASAAERQADAGSGRRGCGEEWDRHCGPQATKVAVRSIALTAL